MAENTRNLVIVITHGIDHELSSAGLTIACGGRAQGVHIPYQSGLILHASARPT